MAGNNRLWLNEEEVIKINERSTSVLRLALSVVGCSLFCGIFLRFPRSFWLKIWPELKSHYKGDFSISINSAENGRRIRKRQSLLIVLDEISEDGGKKIGCLEAKVLANSV